MLNEVDQATTPKKPLLLVFGYQTGWPRALNCDHEAPKRT